MRSLWAVLAGSLVVALLMQTTNCVFEAAGSVPDLEGCGFFAGGLGLLAIIYPTLSALVAHQFGRRPVNLWNGNNPSVGGIMGGLGASIYLGIGIALALFRGHSEVLSPIVAVYLLAFAALSFAGGFAVALISEFQAKSFAFRDSGS